MSDAGPGCTIQVTWHEGSCRLSAVRTGRTCTASPMALIITMPTRPRGCPLAFRSDGGVGEVMRGHGKPLQLGFVDCHLVLAGHLAGRPGEAAHVALGDAP